MQSLFKTEAGQYRYSCTYALNLLLALNWQDIAQGTTACIPAQYCTNEKREHFGLILTFPIV